MSGPSCPSRRRRWQIGLAVAAPLLVWLLVVVACPTDWARRRIERELAEQTRCPATVGAVRLGLFGGVQLVRVEIMEPGAGPDRTGWLRARDVRVDLGWLGLFSGDVRPERVRVDGLILRLGRDADGRFPLADLLCRNPDGPADPSEAHGPDDEDERAFAVELTQGVLILDDVPSASTTRVEGITAHVEVGPEAIRVAEFEGQVKGGLVRLAADIDRGTSPSFDMRLTGKGVRLGRELMLLDLILPFLPGIDRDQVGLVDAEVELSGRGGSFATLRESLRGRGRIAFDPIKLEDSFLTGELARLIPLPADARVGSLRSEFLVHDQQITTTTLRMGLGPREVRLSGYTTFDGQLSYQMDLDGLSERLSERMPQLFSALALESTGLLRVEIDGRVDAPVLRVNGKPVGRGTDAEKTFREVGKRLKDRFLR